MCIAYKYLFNCYDASFRKVCRCNVLYINQNGIIFIIYSFNFVSIRAVEGISNPLKEGSLFFATSGLIWTILELLMKL